jgi:predicted phage terminase large subunit-like protein
MNQIAAIVPPRTRRLASLDSPERIALEATLGPRRFGAFLRMAWRFMDPAHLLWNWHIDLLCEEMEAVARRQHREAVFCIPPRSLKSQIMSVAFPAWVWTWHPSAKFLCGSNEMTLATRDAVKCRRLVKSTWYQKRWGAGSAYVAATILSDGMRHPGVTIVKDQDNKTYYETTAGGHRFACTPGSNVTGHGGDYVMVDDPHPAQKAESEAERNSVLLWWGEAIPSRLNEPDRGVKMVIQQRVHAEDLAGWCMKRGYHKVVLPMRFEPDHPDRHAKDPRTEPGEILHKTRISEDALKSLERALGQYAVAGQLQQRPGPRDGGLFKRGWFQFVDAVPADAMGRLRRWDLAATVPEPGKDPDWTAGVRASKDKIGRVYIEHALRLRDTPAQVDSAIKATAQADGMAVPIWIPQDPGQAGVAQAQAMVRFLAPYTVKIEKESGDKATRARGLASMMQAGQVFLVRGSWNEEFIDELCAFPNGSHDDQLDAAAGAFNALYGGNLGFFEFMQSQVQAALG